MKVVERGSGRDTEDTNTGKSNRYPNFHSKTTVLVLFVSLFFIELGKRKNRANRCAEMDIGGYGGSA